MTAILFCFAFQETIVNDYNLLEIKVVTSDMLTKIMNEITSSPNSSDLQIASSKLFEIGDQCQNQKVNLYIDAEHSHLQPAVRLLTLNLMKNYNNLGNKSPLIYNTYQCYLKDSLLHLCNDIELARSEHFPLACKLVR